MNKLKMTFTSMALCALALPVSSAIAHSEMTTVDDYFNNMNKTQRHEFDFDVRRSEIETMLSSGRVDEANCVVERFIDQNESDNRPSDGLIFMWQVLDMAKREGRTDMDAERLIRGVMITLFKQCEQSIQQGQTVTDASEPKTLDNNPV